MVKDNEIVIVDEFTGRLMEGRRWSDGLHQAIEAKEGVTIKSENQTLASITFQNFFRMYNKMSGMTGTAETEATEFGQIYNLEVTVIPTNKPMLRLDQADLIYKTEKEKFKEDRRFLFMVHLVESVRLQYRLPNTSGLKLLVCAARGIWIWCDQLAQIML